MQAEDLPLFAGIKEKERAVRTLTLREVQYPRGGRVLTAGDTCGSIGVLESGGADIVREDAGGDPVTVAHIGEGEMFAEAFACSGERLTVSVVAKCIPSSRARSAVRRSENSKHREHRAPRSGSSSRPRTNSRQAAWS